MAVVEQSRVAQSVAPATDAELLERFVGADDEKAFAGIVGRYGPMVLQVCRSVLRSEADAEDAFQAVFLQLARKAAGIRRAGALPAWLHRTAQRTAVYALKRRMKYASVAAPLDAEPAAGEFSPLASRQLRWSLHEQIARLGEQPRTALLLYYFAGATAGEAAEQLGISEEAFKGRLRRARKTLARRLAVSGASVGAAAMLLDSASCASLAGLPAGPTAAGCAAVGSHTLFGGASLSAASPSALSLAEGVTTVMLFDTIAKSAAAGLAALALATTGVVAAWADEQAAAQNSAPAGPAIVATTTEVAVAAEAAAPVLGVLPDVPAPLAPATPAAPQAPVESATATTSAAPVEVAQAIVPATPATSVAREEAAQYIRLVGGEGDMEVLASLRDEIRQLQLQVREMQSLASHDNSRIGATRAETVAQVAQDEWMVAQRNDEERQQARRVESQQQAERVQQEMKKVRQIELEAMQQRLKEALSQAEIQRHEAEADARAKLEDQYHRMEAMLKQRMAVEREMEIAQAAKVEAEEKTKQAAKRQAIEAKLQQEQAALREREMTLGLDLKKAELDREVLRMEYERRQLEEARAAFEQHKADQEVIAELRSEVRSLQEENRRLAEQLERQAASASPVDERRNAR